MFTCTQISTAAETQKIISPQAIESYIKQFNVSSDEAKKRLEIMDQSQIIVDKVIKEFGEDLIAGVFFDNGEEFKFIVRTTKGGNKYNLVSDFVQKELKGLPIEVIPNSPRNFRAIENIIQNQSNRFARQIPGFQSLAYNPKTDSLVVNIVEQDKTKKESLIQEYNLKKISGMETKVNLLDGEISLVTLAGGGALLNPNNTPACTAGWPAKNLAGEAGIITAYHCLRNGTFMDFNYKGNDGSTYPLKAVMPTTSTHDLAFLKAPAGTSVSEPVFYKDYSQTSYYVYSGFPKTFLKATETQLCHFGRTTEFSCGIVSDTNAYMLRLSSAVKDRNGNWVGACNSSSNACGPMVTITGPTLKCQTGDSGGPVFYGTNRPQGIASACNLLEISKGQPAVLYFSPLDFASEIPATIQTVPWG